MSPHSQCAVVLLRNRSRADSASAAQRQKGNCTGRALSPNSQRQHSHSALAPDRRSCCGNWFGYLIWTLLPPSELAFCQFLRSRAFATSLLCSPYGKHCAVSCIPVSRASPRRPIYFPLGSLQLPGPGMASQGRMMWSAESSFNYLEYARLSPSPSSSSSPLPLSPASPSYQKDDDIQDVLGRGAAPLKAMSVFYPTSPPSNFLSGKQACFDKRMADSEALALRRYVAIVDAEEYSQCLMKQDDWDALTSHFGVDPGFVDACVNDGLASDGRADNGMRDGKGERSPPN
jgi:hypothetical protein